MNHKKKKLELTWIGKEYRPRLEPRILLEDIEKSYFPYEETDSENIYDNKLIYGDNLLALKSLESEYTGKIKCIYIDPPFNTGQAFDHYEDGLEHSIWLDLMSKRLEILYRLLSDRGLLWVHLDDSEVHYMKIILDEIFGRENFVNQIVYERSGSAGLGQGGAFVDTAEYILLYKKQSSVELNNITNNIPLDLRVMKRYKKILIDEGSKELIKEFPSRSNDLPVKIYKHKNFKMSSISLKEYEKRKEEINKEYAIYYDQIFRTTNPQKENSFQNDIISNLDKSSLYTVEYTPSRGKYKNIPTTLYYYNKEIFAWLKDSAELVDGQVVKTNKLTNIWVHADIPKADLANEGGVNFKRGKKPENLIKRILELSTQPGDIVLDSFAGSGTTGATAHKMRRRWIMIELGEHCHTHIIPRLKNIINGRDNAGISKSVNWTGGGGFHYYKLAQSMLEKDKWGNWVINKKYNANMLAEAMCKLMGFTYFPDPNHYWNHGYSTENDFIYITTTVLTNDQLRAISEEVGRKRTLLICCKGFNANSEAFFNITLKKIPQAVLKKCEWGKDDYSLNIENIDDLIEEGHSSFCTESSEAI